MVVSSEFPVNRLHLQFKTTFQFKTVVAALQEEGGVLGEVMLQPCLINAEASGNLFSVAPLCSHLKEHNINVGAGASTDGVSKPVSYLS